MSVTPTRLQHLLSPLVSEPVYDFWASKFGAAQSWQRCLAVVTRCTPEGSGAVTLELKANRHFQGFVPGQHLNVSAEVNGRKLTRSYSFTTLDRGNRRFAITVKQVPGGLLSTHLCQDTRPGDVLELSPAFGDLRLPAAPQPVLLLAAGSGITPMMSFVRALAAQGMPAPCTLMVWARHREEFCFAAELRALAAAHRQFTVQFVLTGDVATQHDEDTGRPQAEHFQTLPSPLAETASYACGPSGFVEAIARLVGTHCASFAAEAFTPPAPVSAAPGGSLRITLAASNRVVELPAGQPLLAALEAQGIHPPSGCRMGICNTCACSKLSGASRNLHSGSQSHEPESALRLCVSAATSDLVLDL